MNWSPYQDAIFRFITEDGGNASIEAVAGSGKSSTMRKYELLSSAERLLQKHRIITNPEHPDDCDKMAIQ